MDAFYDIPNQSRLSDDSSPKKTTGAHRTVTLQSSWFFETILLHESETRTQTSHLTHHGLQHFNRQQFASVFPTTTSGFMWIRENILWKLTDSSSIKSLHRPKQTGLSDHLFLFYSQHGRQKFHMSDSRRRFLVAGFWKLSGTVT